MRLPTGPPPRKARPKIESTRPRSASGAISCTSELRVEKAVVRVRPEPTRSAIDSHCQRESAAPIVTSPKAAKASSMSRPRPGRVPRWAVPIAPTMAPTPTLVSSRL